MKKQEITFEKYLKHKGLAQSSIRMYKRNTEQALAFMDCPGQAADIKHIQLYINYLQANQKPKRYINEQLRGLRHYFRYLIQEKKRLHNPLEHLYLRGISQAAAQDILSISELREALELYQRSYPRDLFRQAALCLYIYQGASTADLGSLERAHIDLEAAKIHFPGSSQTAPRSLHLAASQILLLQKYLSTLEAAQKPFPEGTILVNRLVYLFKNQLTKLAAPANRIRKAHQIRASVLSHWLKTEDIRQVQYKAGHRYISSTEAYQHQDLESLQEDLKKYHPLANYKE